MGSQFEFMKQDTEHITEYDEAIERFENRKNRNEPPSIINSNHSNPILDNLIEDLCKGDNSRIRASDITLFFELIFYIDYKKIKTNFIETIYAELCNIFVLSAFVDDISSNLNRLDSISHVKTNIMQGFLKILQVKASVADNCLILAYSNIKMWSDFYLSKINGIQILPCAFKVMFCNNEFGTSHLNFLQRLADVENVILKDCNLNGRNPENVLKNVEIKTLNLSKCGTSVNRILQSSPDIFLNLTCLNIEGNPLQNESLCIISNLPLKTLNISECIRRGKFVGLVWIDIPESNMQETWAHVDVNLLWATGALKRNIQNLDVSYNDLSLEDFINIMKLDLKELNIAGSFKKSYLSQVIIPNSLRVLKASNIRLTYDEFKILCGTKLEKLDIDYGEREFQNFTLLSNAPLLNTLTELTVWMHEYSEAFLDFISKFNLKYFSCSMSAVGPIDPFFLNNPEKRKHLETLIISDCEIKLENEVLLQLRMLNLMKLSISVRKSELKYTNILSSKNLQNSLVSLQLKGNSVGNEDMLLISQFKQLENLSFVFNKNIDEKYLKMVLEMKTLKNLDLEAFIRTDLDLHMARLLCIAHVKRLEIFDLHRIITPEALKYLTHQENSVQFTKNLEELSIACEILPAAANILKLANWKSITFNLAFKCEGNFLEALFENANLKYTLQNFYASHDGFELSNVADLMLSSWEDNSPEFYDEFKNFFEVLNNRGPLFKFLYSMVLFVPSDIDVAILSETNLSIVRLIKVD